MHSEPPEGIDSAAWLPLVLTVNGLVVLAPPPPYVVVHVVPTFGTEGTNRAQLAPDTTPALMATRSSVLPAPPVQYMGNVHTPAGGGCPGRAGTTQGVWTPPGGVVSGQAARSSH